MNPSTPQVTIIGGGPAGLTAGYVLSKRGLLPAVYESGDRVGGIARTESHKGYLFDIGGHRFFSKVPEVTNLWHELLGDDMIKVPRLSRIYYNGKFFNYPLSIPNVVKGLGLIESGLIFLSYVKSRLFPQAEEESFEDWVVNRFGDRLYRTFFKGYTEKVWGIPCKEIRADWAAQRIKGLSFASAVKNAIFKSGGVKSLIGEFDYPRLGPGQMWERAQQRIVEAGGSVHLKTKITKVRHAGHRVESITVSDANGTREEQVNQLVTSMPVSSLVRAMDPVLPKAAIDAANGLKYRDFLIVTLVVDKNDLFPDNWIYVHSPEVKVGRIQNFRNWSAAMVPDPSHSSLGMEYFCSQGDALWKMEDKDLIQLAGRELKALGLNRGGKVIDGCVIRQLKAYPVYDADYRRHLAVLRHHLSGFQNLQTIGRNGMHRYNNQDHSMLCGIYAAENILGAQHDLWEVNTERSYHEEQVIDRDKERISSSSVPESVV